MLMKLTPGLNFFNVLRTAFMLVDPKSVKKIDNLTVFFTLLGSTSVKAACRTLMKLTPDWKIVNGFTTVLLSTTTKERISLH